MSCLAGERETWPCVPVDHGHDGGVRSPRFPLLTLFVLLLAAPSASAVETMRIVDPVTDNYKASYGADPTVPERRTWLAIRSISVGGTTWAPKPPAEILITPGATVEVVGADG